MAPPGRSLKRMTKSYKEFDPAVLSAILGDIAADTALEEAETAKAAKHTASDRWESAAGVLI